MKKIFFIVWILAIATMFVACERDEEATLTTINVVDEELTPSYTSAEVQCRFDTKATLRNVYLQYASINTFAEYEEIEMQEESGLYKAQLTGLYDNTTYYIRYVASNRYSSIITKEICEFKTLQPSVPSVVLDSITTIWDISAKAHVHLANDGGAPISEMGICWGVQPAPVVENNKLTTKDTVVALEMKDLQPNTKYYVRAYAINKMGISYGEEKSFISLTSPKVQTNEVQNIPNSSAVLLNGTLTFNGNDAETIVGFCWSEETSPSIVGNHQEVKAIDYAFTYQLSNLKDETLYYVCTYAKNKIGIIYGEVLSFTTKKAMLPIVTTTSVTNISYRSATIGGNIANDGGAPITQCGVVYSKSPNPTIDNNDYKKSEKDTCLFTVDLNDLSVETTYYVRAYAVNRVGIAYGNAKLFGTKIVPKRYVDLGLSVKWATFNVGASKPEEFGDYFAWGETQPKEVYDYTTYKWCNGTYDTYTKYNTDGRYGTVDNRTVLEASDDAATANWGDNWRMPTWSECEELRENCTCTWSTRNGVNGYEVISKQNGKSIFLPVAGIYDHDGLTRANSGYYWSSSYRMGHADSPHALELSDASYISNFCLRYLGCSVRPVCP